MTEGRKTIFAVDDNGANLVACKQILRPFYEVYPIPSAEKMFKLLEHVTPDLILLDVEMPEMNGYEAARRLKSGEHNKIPVIFLTARDDPESEQTGLNLGALDYIRKPFSSSQLLERIRNHLPAAVKENES